MQLAQSLLREELIVFEKKFRDAVKSQTPLLDRITRFIVNRKGKQIRPMFVFLSARLCGPVNESTYRAASLVELVHTASLVHDDVVDESLERRGFFSTYALWKNKISVLVGDYLLVKGLLLSLDYSEFRILQLLSVAVQKMSEGELLQIENRAVILECFPHLHQETNRSIDHRPIQRKVHCFAPARGRPVVARSLQL